MTTKYTRPYGHRPGEQPKVDDTTTTQESLVPTNAKMFQLKVTLQGVRPLVWRRILVPGSFTLAKLHIVLQIAMGWSNSHLHEFTVRGQRYASLESEPEEGTLDEKRARLDKVLHSEKDRMLYEYDFGDGWEHVIVVERILPCPDKQARASCTAGKRACPPEDCGGPLGYDDVLIAVADPNHPQHEETVDWLVEDFDSEYFDITIVNAVLKNLTSRQA